MEAEHKATSGRKIAHERLHGPDFAGSRGGRERNMTKAAVQSCLKGLKDCRVRHAALYNPAFWLS